MGANVGSTRGRHLLDYGREVYEVMQSCGYLLAAVMSGENRAVTVR